MKKTSLTAQVSFAGTLRRLVFLTALLASPAWGQALDGGAESDAGPWVAEVVSIDAGVPIVPVASSDMVGVQEITVRSRGTVAQQMMASAEAVNVLDLRRARQQSADLGEVLARTQGVAVRREGGLGSGATISLNGLQNEQVRIFLDGVPLERTGYPFGLTNVPVNLVERVEMYRGVVPVRLGADALGGAINLISDPRYETHVAASYQGGSFGLHRSSVNGRYRHDRTGIVAGVSGFVDSAKNNFFYDDREIQQPDGSSVTRRLRRFHDAYRAYGGTAEVGVVDKRWAKRLIVSGFAATMDKDVQHNTFMSLVFGEVTRGQDSYGSTVRYEVDLTPSLTLESFVNYSRRRVDFRDVSKNKYNWAGDIVDTFARGNGGEIGGRPTNTSLFEDGIFSRTMLTWVPATGHALRASLTPSFASRHTENHLPAAENRNLKDKIVQFVAGAEHQFDWFQDRLSNIAFAKLYSLRTSHDSIPEGTLRIKRNAQRTIRNWGIGDSLRFRFTNWLMAKLSYEYTTRLPNTDELFGDGVLVEPNAQLKPERSHNVNFGPRITVERARFGSLTLDINAFLRETKDQILFIARSLRAPYSNVSDARGRGLENAVSWSAPGRWLGIDSSLTWLDLRNTSDQGVFAALRNLRMPNRPWLFASWGARLRFDKLPRRTDTLEPFYFGRYTHRFDRGWAIVAPSERLHVPYQINHDLGATYSITRRDATMSATFECDNLTDARLYDLWGVQRPGRGFYLKLTAQL
ncbi:MAG: TonB-dependent receptor [Polyangiales bacterium]